MNNNKLKIHPSGMATFGKTSITYLLFKSHLHIGATTKTPFNLRLLSTGRISLELLGLSNRNWLSNSKSDKEAERLLNDNHLFLIKFNQFLIKCQLNDQNDGKMSKSIKKWLNKNEKRLILLVC